jgi:hypothetical protein
VQREAETQRLDWWEWTLPLLLGGALLLVAGAMVGVAVALYYALFEAPLPALGDILGAAR